MDGPVKNLLWVTFLVCTLWKYTEGYKFAHHQAFVEHNNRTLGRFRRQTDPQTCNGNVSKFQCATTAECIDVDLECDGKEDCPDGSDEKESLCKDFPKCTTPPQPRHGQWIFLKDGRRGAANIKIHTNTVITYSCQDGYNLSATNEAALTVLCLDTGEWSVTVVPTCLKLCPRLYHNPLITLSCKNDGAPVPCDKATDNTVLTYKCAPYYEPPPGRVKGSTCYDGLWDYTPKCIPVCGEKRVSATPLIVNGNEVERGDYPWVVAIYSNKDTDPYYTNICGGSLITTDIVVTAAHCVTKKETGKAYHTKYYRVAAGKYYNKYDDARDNDTSQFAEIDQIEANREYRGEIQNFRGDIALLKLKTHFTVSKVVQPVCYDNLPHLEVNSIGLVTGWGYTTTSGKPSDVLKQVNIPYNDEAQCLNDLDFDFAQKYFTTDKLCAGFNDQNTSVCKGDAGGGLVFRNPYYKRRYFIQGILSVDHSYSDQQEIHCNIQRSALFTKVDNYIDWIQLKVRQWTREGCITPPQPTHGQWIYSNGTRGDANIKINTNTVITYSCDFGFNLSSTDFIYFILFNEVSYSTHCLDTGEWDVTVGPTCQKLCPSIYVGPLITLSCTKDGFLVSCDKATDNTILTYECAPNYKPPHGRVKSSECYDRTWTTITPECIPDLCPSLSDSPLITHSCKNDGSPVPCDKATINTILTYECAPYYEPPLGSANISTCYNGTWSYTPQCIPVCGEKRVSATPLIVNSHEVERGYYPWVVAIYSSKDSSPRYLNICGGSLITTDIVVTAAHCVTKKETGMVFHTKFFRVAAGKYYNRYDDARDNDTSQFAEVAKIELHREYVGEIRNFRGDIALFKLKTHFALSKVVQPVCYDNLPPLEVNSIGLVTGWGYTTTTGQPSDVLKELDMPYNDEFQCLSDFDTYFSQKYFTPDKLCAGFTDRNTSVCKGDSGGGLVFRNPSYKQRYFIHGIVSLGHSYTYNQEVHCNIQRSALFTKVGYYHDWIQSKVRQWSTD